MNLINPGGLLWFDDDSRRSIQQKIAEAAQRFRERVGFEPTICQLNPAQATALEASANQPSTRTKRASSTPAPTLPDTLRLVPSALIQPHCYLVGIAEGDQPRAAALPYRDDEETDTPRATRKSALAHVAAATNQATAQRVPAASRRAPSRSPRVHAAVQPALIEAAISHAPEESAPSQRALPSRVSRVVSRASSRVASNPHPEAHTAAPSRSTSKATIATTSPVKPSAARSPRARSTVSATPASLLAVAPATPSGVGHSARRTRPAKLATLYAPTLPLPELAIESQPRARHERTSRQSKAEKSGSARHDPQSGNRRAKRSA